MENIFGTIKINWYVVTSYSQLKLRQAKAYSM